MEKITKSSDKVLIDPNEPLILPDGTALVGRVEWFLYALCCLDYQNLPTPMSRIEEFANALITGEIPNIQPQSRAEQFFLAILDGNISDLPQPQSRSEVLLDKLARGEFDLSDVEPIQSSYELLLAYLIKNGGIGNIDYVLYEFSEAMKTMYNTVEKPFKSLELSGNTLVNCVLEDTENDDYTSFDKDYSGTSFTINGTSEGAIKSAILKGQTLVNLYKANTTKSSSDSGFYFVNTIPSSMFKSNTYTIINTTNKKLSIAIRSISSNAYVRNIEIDALTKIAVTLSDDEWIRFFIASTSNGWVNGDANDESMLKKMVVVEGDYTNVNIPYFEGMQSVKMPVLKTTGKNLFDMNIMETSKTGDGWTYERTENLIHFTSDGTKAYQQYRLDITNHLANKIKLGKPYSFTSDTSKNITNDALSVCQLMITNKDGSKHYYDAPRVFTLNKEFSQIDIRIIGHNHNEVGIPSDYTIKNIQLEEGSTATSYEPYKSNILSCNEEVELRGIGNVKDELNLVTSELTQRIGEATFRGAENETWGRFDDSAIQENTCLFSFYGGLPTSPKEDLKMLSDKYIIKNGYATLLNTDEEMVHAYSDRAVYFRVLKSKLSTQNVTGFKEWLSQNPFTIQYQLKTESVKTVDLNVVDQNNTKIDKIHVFDGTTHVNASSDELTPTVNIGKSVSYPTIIKPNTKYTVDLKRNDKPLTVNLGGTEVTFTSGETRKIITTPSTLTNDKLSYYGMGQKCSDIMVLEGEVEGNVDYFTDMQSVVMQNQMPTLHTVGKNLFDYSSHPITLEKLAYADGQQVYWTGYIGVKTYVPVKENTTYTYSNDINVGIHFGLVFYDDDKSVLSYIDNFNTNNSFTSFTTPKGCKFIRFAMETQTIPQWIQLEEATSPTSYESYKSSILSYNDDVTLRGIGDVRDTLDCLTGEIVERVGVGVFDGSEDEGWQLLDSNDNYVTFVTYRPLPNIKDNKNSICDKLPFQGHMTPEDAEYHSVQSFGSYINVLSSKASNVVEFKNWLSQNNLTIYYPLTTESIKTVDLSVVDQDGNTIPKVKSYNGTTHLEVTVSKQSLLPNVSAEVATDNSKDMSSLTTKHQEISETQSAIQDNIQFQSDEIDTALMATTEIFESILE